MNKISTCLSNNKTISQDQIGVYCFPCHCCPTVYVGETKRNLPIRLQEHLRDIRNEKPTSGPFMHIKDNPSHYFDANDARIIDRERNDSLRRFKESIYISKSSAYNCNLERGIFVNPIWSATLNIFFKSP